MKIKKWFSEDRMFEHLTKKMGLGEAEKKIVKKIHHYFGIISYSILKFLAFRWVVFRFYERIGFEKTVLIILIIIVILMRLNLRHKN